MQRSHVRYSCSQEKRRKAEEELERTKQALKLSQLELGKLQRGNEELLRTQKELEDIEDQVRLAGRPRQAGPPTNVT
eukprot:3848735-Prymnesium_polylepis.1